MNNSGKQHPGEESIYDLEKLQQRDLPVDDPNPTPTKAPETDWFMHPGPKPSLMSNKTRKDEALQGFLSIDKLDPLRIADFEMLSEEERDQFNHDRLTDPGKKVYQAMRDGGDDPLTALWFTMRIPGVLKADKNRFDFSKPVDPGPIYDDDMGLEDTL